MTRRQLQLVYLAKDTSKDALRSAVTNIGYVVNPVPWKEWIIGNSFIKPVPVILFFNDTIPRNLDIATVFNKNGISSCLGVCCSAEQYGYGQILKNCTDFLAWPCHADELAMRLARTFGEPSVPLSENHESDFLDQFVNLNLLGRSSAFVTALTLIKKYALCDAPVLIEGETGTGKELASRAIHYLSKRRDHPFVPVNCGAIPDNLLENELFGHEKGAFTDAKNMQPGLVEEANNGTLLLDEVDSLSAKAQVALLRFIENSEYRSLGSISTKKANVRLIVATNASLLARTREGSFRKDLLYRLNVLSVRLPPLRERGDDIQLLAEYFIRKYSRQYDRPVIKIHPGTLKWMLNYSWPGNVRELDNFLHQAFLLNSGTVISLPEKQEEDVKIEENRGANRAFAHDDSLKSLKQKTIETLEKEYLCWLMEETQGNISLAARRAGQQRSALRRLLNKYGIDKNAWTDCTSV